MSTKVPPLERRFYISWYNVEFIIDTACFSLLFFFLQIKAYSLFVTTENKCSLGLK